MKSDVWPALSTAQLQLTNPQNPACYNLPWWTSSTYYNPPVIQNYYLEYLLGNGTWSFMGHDYEGGLYARPAIYVLAD